MAVKRGRGEGGRDFNGQCRLILYKYLLPMTPRSQHEGAHKSWRKAVVPTT